MRTSGGFSPIVSAGNVWFTTLGFMGIYTVLSILFLFLIWRQIENGAAQLNNDDDIFNEEIVVTESDIRTIPAV